jgi:hypothetical protein
MVVEDLNVIMARDKQRTGMVIEGQHHGGKKEKPGRCLHHFFRIRLNQD